jgi:hypothetical protein
VLALIDAQSPTRGLNTLTKYAKATIEADANLPIIRITCDFKAVATLDNSR